MLRSILAVALGGAIGSALRYAASIYIARFYLQKFPLSTFLINIIGCFFIGLIAGYFTKDSNSEHMRLFLITGLCGGFTTFSAFGAENLELLRSGEPYLAALYILLSVIFGIGLVAVGLYVSSQ